MMNEEAAKIEAEIWDNDAQVVVYFKWDHKGWHQPVRVDSRDGTATLWLFLEDARELHRKLGEALDGHPAIPPERVQEVKDAVAQQLQDHADAGPPDPEEKAAEADWRGNSAEEPSARAALEEIEAARSGA